MRLTRASWCHQQVHRLQGHRQRGTLPHPPQPDASSKLEDLALSANGKNGTSKLGDITVLAAGTQLLRLKLPKGPLTNLAPLAAMANLQSLDMSWCCRVSDLAPLAALVKLQSLIMVGCRAGG
jgi:hypothetical protein